MKKGGGSRTGKRKKIPTQFSSSLVGNFKVSIEYHALGSNSPAFIPRVEYLLDS